MLAVFYLKGCTKDERQAAIRAHALFLQDYPSLTADTFPLLVYDSGKGGGGGGGGSSSHGPQLPAFFPAPAYGQPCVAAPLLPGQTHARCLV